MIQSISSNVKYVQTHEPNSLIKKTTTKLAANMFQMTSFLRDKDRDPKITIL